MWLAKLVSLLLLFSLCKPAHAASLNNNSQEQNGVKRIFDRVEIMRHELNNHDAQLKSLEDRLRNEEETIAGLRIEMDSSSKAHKDSLKGRSESSEATIKSLTTDLKQLQTHANQSSSVLEQYQKRIAELEKTVDRQARNIDSLKSAMQSLMQAIKGETAVAIAEIDTKSSDSPGIYRVQSGDSLGSIAQKFHTTIRDLKEANSLKNNTIIIGQKLKVPGNGTHK